MLALPFQPQRHMPAPAGLGRQGPAVFGAQGKALDVANKLRLLRLPEDVLNAMRNAGLTERHGRALLRLETPAEQREALAYILSRDLNVAATDAYIERLLEAKAAPESEQQKTFILKDVRVFLNTISHSLDLMKQGGIDAGVERKETDSELIFTISIPKNKLEQ